MNARNARTLRRAAAVTGTLAVVGLSTAAPSLAAGGSTVPGVNVVNTETVKVYMSADGDVQSKRVYEQLALSGHGSVDIKNPVSTDGLRNLDGFSGFQVKNGEQVIKTTVNGTENYRSVSNFTGTLPVSVATQYTLNGKRVAPGDIVGKSGKLGVQFVVTNKTSKKQQVTISDGNGGTITKTVDVPIPMVGSLTTTAPSNFHNVNPGGANTAGDGAGGTTMSYTMTLFPPLGSDSATLGYTADITDGVVPRVEISMLPVDPLASPTFKSAASSYQGGAETGAQLVTGANTIDANLLKLRDGAAQLLAGLIKLSDGANQLNAGLANDAAPGAKKLAAGAGDLRTGLGKLDAGAGDLSDGAGQLDAGAKKLAGGTSDALAGSKKLQGGLTQISGGLSQLAAQLPTASTGISQLQAGVDLLIAGFGSDAQPTSIIGGLHALEVGLGDAATNGTLINGVTQLRGGLAQLTAANGLPQAQGGVDQVKSGLDANIASGGPLDQLIGAADLLESTLCLQGVAPLEANCVGTATALKSGLQAAKTQLQTASGGLGQVSTGLGGAISQIHDLMIPGADQVLTGLAGVLSGVQQLHTGALSAKGGAQQVRAGLDQLSSGLAAAVSGVLQLNTGAGQALTGSGDLSTGLGLLAAGAGDLSTGTGQLSAGASKLAAGTGRADDGAGQLADGADKLASGLTDAADGSGQIADGLKTASGGAPQLVDGAGRLSKEGMGQLISAGKSTAVNYGELYSVIKAGSERAQSSSMAYGAPAGAEGLTAYSITLTGEDGEGNRNLARTGGALGLAALGAGVFLMRRRMV